MGCGTLILIVVAGWLLAGPLGSIIGLLAAIALGAGRAS
jgi:hypothetical protein